MFHFNIFCAIVYQTLGYIYRTKYKATVWNVLFFFDVSDDHGFTPLHWASREGWVAIFDILVARGARINNLNNGGDTPLHCAVSKGQKTIVTKVRSN